MTFKYVELFAGIGGFRQALDKLGGECVMASEIDKYASQAYRVLYDGAEELQGDVTKIEAEDVPDHDILVGGFPCQAFSVAGKRLGFEDTRGTLFFEIVRIAKVKRPKVMLMENVKGLVGHDKGRTLDVIVQTLGDIGYTVDFEVLNSKYFGVPQNRERIFIVAIRDDLVTPSPWVIGKRTDVVAKGKRRIAELEGVKTFNFDYPLQDAVTTRLRDILECNVDERFYLKEEMTRKLISQLEDKNSDLLESKDATPYPTMSGEIGYCLKVNTHRCYLPKHVEKKEAQLVIEPQMIGHIDLKGHDAIKRVYATEGVSPTLTTMGGGHREPKIVEEVKALTERRSEEAKEIRREYREKYGKDFSPRRSKVVVPREDNVANCVTATQGIEQQILEKPRYRIRKLTPKECFLLQGFSSEDFDKLTANGISNSQLYKMAGNAVTVNVIDAIGKRLLHYLG